MNETSTTATLVDPGDPLATRSSALSATVPREEIETALALDPPADLILEVVRRREGADDERRSVSVAWTRADLETVLGDRTAEAITFAFDPAELEQTFAEDEVEGHGLRETAVVLSIAAAAAVSGASGAYAAGHDEASMAERGIAVQATVHDEATLGDRGIGVGIASSHDEATLAARGVEAGALSATHDEATLTARGVEPGTLPAVHDEATLAARGVQPGTLPGVHDEATLVARGIEAGTLPSTHDEATLVARGIEAGTLPATHDEATLTARGVEPISTPTGGEAASGFDLPSVDPGTAAGIAGGIAGAGLLIAAAAFATRRREPGAV